MHPSRIADEGAGGQGAVEDAVEDPLLVLAREMRELFGRIPSSACSSSSSFSVPRIACPTPLQFYRDWVAPNRPVIITGAVDNWPAMRRWTNDYLLDKMGGQEVTVDSTPDGHGDTVKRIGAWQKRGGRPRGADAEGVCKGEKEEEEEHTFIMPLETKMRFSRFLRLVGAYGASGGGGEETGCAGPETNRIKTETEREEEEKGQAPAFLDNCVHYCQHQNDSMAQEFSCLLNDIQEPAFASEAFGQCPDAVNMWMGDDRAVSSVHSDPYENIYAVVRGTKVFTLFPPGDLPALGGLRKWPSARYCAPHSQSAPASTPSSLPLGVEEVREGQGCGNVMMTPWLDVAKIDQHIKAVLPPLPPRHGETSKEVAVGGAGETEGKGAEAGDKGKKEGKGRSTESTESGAGLPGLSHSNPVRAVVGKGELLFLPALWFHKVEQRGQPPAASSSGAGTGGKFGSTIAVNFWYDMQFDGRWAMKRFAEAVMAERLSKQQTEQVRLKQPSNQALRQAAKHISQK